MIRVAAVPGDITTVDADAIVVNLFEGVRSPGGGTGPWTRRSTATYPS